MHDNMKEVSIVLGTYNGEKYLKKQLESLVNQTYPIKEIIIQDDNSTDNSWLIIQEFSNRFSYIKAFRNKCQKNINDNYFSAMDLCSGEYIAISDQDDIWELNKVEEQMKSIGNNLLSFCYSIPFSNDLEYSNINKLRVPNYQILRMLFTGCIPGHTMIINKKILKLIPFKQKFYSQIICDQMLQIAAAINDSIVFCPTTHVNYRKNEGSATYGPPLNYNILISIKRTWELYRKIKPQINNHLINIQKYIEMIPGDLVIKNKVNKLIKYETGDDCLSLIKASIFCFIHRDELFYSNDGNKFLRALRSFYFPISCTDYLRYYDSKSIQ